uniref:Uncharacterized protein n=1 Tax=Sphaerodactylus townsendi TaxID=933632 RepID=A0ACB8FZL2_9SAUR
MAPALLIFAILIYSSGLSSGATLAQRPSLSVPPGQTAEVSCNVSGSVSNFHWLRQRPGQGPHFVVYGTSSRGEGIPDRFTGSSSGRNRYLTIQNSKAEDEADYYCAAWDDTGKQSHSAQP